MEVSRWGKKRPTARNRGWRNEGMNNGWRDGVAKHYCNLCLTKLKTCPGSHLWNSGPSNPGWLRVTRLSCEKAQDGFNQPWILCQGPTRVLPSERSAKVMSVILCADSLASWSYLFNNLWKLINYIVWKPLHIVSESFNYQLRKVIFQI